MKKDGKKDLDIGALLIGMDEPGGEGEDGEAEESDASHQEIARDAMGAFRESLKGDDLDAQVSAFRTLMDACRMYEEE
jgi:hypothetical protein